VAKVNEKLNALQEQVDWQHKGCNEQLAALKEQNEQNNAHYQREKIILQDNCELRSDSTDKNFYFLFYHAQNALIG
jgi:phosphoglycerate-specific signal transduction histidine kinase